jgi:hypothetical protein
LRAIYRESFIAGVAGLKSRLSAASNVVDADVSLVKPLPRTEQFEKRGL